MSRRALWHHRRSHVESMNECRVGSVPTERERTLRPSAGLSRESADGRVYQCHVRSAVTLRRGSGSDGTVRTRAGVARDGPPVEHVTYIITWSAPVSVLGLTSEKRFEMCDEASSG